VASLGLQRNWRGETGPVGKGERREKKGGDRNSREDIVPGTGERLSILDLPIYIHWERVLGKGVRRQEGKKQKIGDRGEN